MGDQADDHQVYDKEKKQKTVLRDHQVTFVSGNHGETGIMGHPVEGKKVLGLAMEVLLLGERGVFHMT